MLLGMAGFLEMVRNNGKIYLNSTPSYSYHMDFCEKRAKEAIEYWKLKCEMVS